MNKLGLVDLDDVFDVTIASGDFSAPMAAWYAKEMGLPINRIIVSCNENGGLWDFLYHGQLRTDAIASATNTPLCDVSIPSNLERLLYGYGGSAAVQIFLDAQKRGSVFVPDESMIERIRQTMYASVVSEKRMESAISNVYRTSTYLLDPYSALAYSGLQDFRATSGEGRTTLLIAEQNPICAASTVSKAMGISVQDLKERLSMT